MAPEKLRRAEEVEACPTSLHVVEFSSSRSKRWQRRTWLLFAIVLVTTAVLSAALGLVVGLGVGHSDSSCSDSAAADTSTGGEATDAVRDVACSGVRRSHHGSRRVRSAERNLNKGVLNYPHS